MKLSVAIAIGLFFASVPDRVAVRAAIAADGEQALLQAHRAVFGPGPLSPRFDDRILDPNFTWTDAFGNTRNKLEVMQDLNSGKEMPREDGGGGGRLTTGTTSAHIYGQVGLIQENSGKVYVLRIWIKRDSGWQLLIYQAVSIGAPPSSEPGTRECDNPCNTVPFQPQTEDEREVIWSYQAVERAVTAHNSAAWGVHIADEFFAVTSNSDRPLTKTSRMAGLDNQKVAGIAPFPLVSARMFEFGEAMVMTSRQQPERGLPLHVTRVWFKRNGAWLEAYSYQTTIRSALPTR
jgi:hypothetical protein